MNTRSNPESGFLLVEALVALGLLGVLMLGAGALALCSVGAVDEAERLECAREAAERILHHLNLVSFQRLPEFFHAAPSATEARLSTSDPSAPEEWSEALSSLPGARAEVVLQGLGVTGEPAALDHALALRLRIRVTYRDGSRQRRASLTTVRF